MTLLEWRNKNKAAVEEALGKDNVNPYHERDSSVERLDNEFFRFCGLTGSNEITEIDFDVAEYDEAAKTIPGYAIYVGEEVMVVYKDGGRIGQMLVSCRGGSWMAECKTNEVERSASDRMPYWH